MFEVELDEDDDLPYVHGASGKCNSTSITTSSPLHCALFDLCSSSENKEEMLFSLYIFYEWKYKAGLQLVFDLRGLLSVLDSW